MDQLFCLLVDRCEVGGAVEQFVQGVAVVDGPRFERTVDGGADQSDHGRFEFVLTEVGVLDGRGNRGDESFAQIFGCQGVRHPQLLAVTGECERPGCDPLHRDVTM